MLTNLEPNDVLFIDEIHRLSPVVEEVPLPALEDYQIDIMIGEGPARSIKIRPAALHLGWSHDARGVAYKPASRPARITSQLQFYSAEDSRRSSGARRAFSASRSIWRAHEIANRSRGTPRVANRLLRACATSPVMHDGMVTKEVASKALKLLDVDPVGLDLIDRRFLDDSGEVRGRPRRD